MYQWIACYSYTGQELYQITKRIDRLPDLIVTNNQRCDRTWYSHTIPKTPSIEDYIDYFNILDLNKPTIVTLHGWNRIIPARVCNHFEMYNIHPGDIINYPDLIGKDPQKRAVELQLPTTGIIIHRVTDELDQGPVVTHVSNIDIKDLSVQEVTDKLRVISVDKWCEFLNKRGII